MIYFIKTEGLDFVRIGYTEKDPESRLTNLQVGCPHGLYILDTMDGGRFDESRLHEIFEDYRERGEWFRISGALKEYLKNIKPSNGVNNSAFIYGKPYFKAWKRLTTPLESMEVMLQLKSEAICENSVGFIGARDFKVRLLNTYVRMHCNTKEMAELHKYGYFDTEKAQVRLVNGKSTRICTITDKYSRFLLKTLRKFPHYKKT